MSHDEDEDRQTLVVREGEPLFTLVMPVSVSNLAWLASKVVDELEGTGHEAFLQQTSGTNHLDLNVRPREDS